MSFPAVLPLLVAFVAVPSVLERSRQRPFAPGRVWRIKSAQSAPLSNPRWYGTVSSVPSAKGYCSLFGFHCSRRQIKPTKQRHPPHSPPPTHCTACCIPRQTFPRIICLLATWMWRRLHTHTHTHIPLLHRTSMTGRIRRASTPLAMRGIRMLVAWMIMRRWPNASSRTSSSLIGDAMRSSRLLLNIVLLLRTGLVFR
ncbi:hypothetical protein C8R46DRAFT_1121568 [Mycena filopes]|nr:hypothetical protein C8R46DRAFT_1121568 [Mycena filopes]